MSPDPDRARVRFETQGSIEDYFQSAAAHAASGARFITVYPAQYKQRAIAAAHASGFSIHRSIDIIPRAGKAALFTLFTCVNKTDDATALKSLSCAVAISFLPRSFEPYGACWNFATRRNSNHRWHKACSKNFLFISQEINFFNVFRLHGAILNAKQNVHIPDNKQYSAF